MEYLEGETLAQRLLKDPLPLEQTLRYAIEISDALDKAHRKGATHRDIKPGNIMLTKIGGTLGTKLLDFGLAKLKQQAAVKPVALASDAPTPPAASPPAGSPTLGGTILGTVQYMAPEQVEGRIDDIDGRSDIFSFGATVYEMLTGKKAFEGKSAASVMSKIMQVDPPPISSLDPPGKTVPPALDRVIKKCLAKEQEDRWQSARDLHDELDWIKQGAGQAGMPVPQEVKSASAAWRRAAAFGLAVLLIAAIAGMVAWMLKPAPPQPVARVAITLPSNVALANLEDPVIAISPDGNYLAYVGILEGKQQLYLRALYGSEARPIDGTDDASNPFFSPDGQWLGYFIGNSLRKISINGGGSVTLGEVLGIHGGADWGHDDRIVFGRGGFSAAQAPSGLEMIPAAGGSPQPLLQLDSVSGELEHQWPQILPGGRAVLFTVTTVRSASSSEEGRSIVVQVLPNGERKIRTYPFDEPK